MTILAILLTALLMGYPLHRAVIQRDEARKQLRLANETADAALDVLGLVMRGQSPAPSNVVAITGRGGRRS